MGANTHNSSASRRLTIRIFNGLEDDNIVYVWDEENGWRAENEPFPAIADAEKFENNFFETRGVGMESQEKKRAITCSVCGETGHRKNSKLCKGGKVEEEGEKTQEIFGSGKKSLFSKWGDKITNFTGCQLL